MNYLKNFPEYKDNPEKLKLDAIEMAKARMPASFDAPQGLKDLSRFKPFLSWTWSAAGIVAKKVLTHPDKIMQFVGMLGMMESMAYAQYGDNLRKDEKEHSMGFGDWLKDMFLVRLPISWTQDGKFSLGPDAQAKTYLDLTWFAPFMDLQAQEGALIPTPFVTNPVLTSAMGIYSGKDPILGTTLVNPWDDGYIKLGKTLGYLNKQFLWNLSPGSAEILNWYDKTFGVGDVRDSGLYKVLANLRSGSQFKRLFEDFSGTGSAAKAPFGARMLRSGLGVPVQILPSEQIAKNMAMYIGEKKKEAGSAVAKVTRMYSKGDIVFDQYKQYVDMIHEQLVHDLMINPD